MKTVMVTGASGFFGGILKRTMLDAGYRVINVDIVRDEDAHPNLTSWQVDIRDRDALDKAFASAPIEGVVHCAAKLAHGSEDPKDLWTSNVDGTRNVMDMMRKHGVRQHVFTSSNCLWGEAMGRPVREDDEPHPVELYGQSKLEGERIIREYSDLNAVLVRCPTIIDFGRLGLLSILFEFIDEGRRVWAVGGGRNRYQFIYAQDLAKACMMSLDYPGSDVFNIGSDDVKSIAEVYEYVIRNSKSNAKLATLPRGPAIAAMKMAYYLKLSPLGPYHYKMIAEDFMFDTARIKERLGWRPTLTNEEMLWRAYEYYRRNRREIEARQDVSAHRKAAKMGIIRLLKWVS